MLFLVMPDADKLSNTADKALFYTLCGVFFVLPLGTSLTLIASASVLCVWFISGKVLRERDRWIRRSWALPIFAFIALHWVGLLYTNDIHLGFITAKKTYYWLMAFAVASISLQKRDVETLIKFFIAGLTVMSAISIAQLAGLLPMTRAITSIFTHHITNSLLLVTGMLVLSFRFRETGGTRPRVLILLAIAVFFLTLVIGISRAGYLALILMSPLILYNLFGRKHIVKVAISAVLVMGAVFLSPTVQLRISEAVKDIKMYAKGEADTSIGLRFVMWSGAVKIIEEDPIFGVGTGGYTKAIRKYNDLVDKDFRDPHSSYLYMTVSFGVFGLACLLWLFFVPLRSGWRSRRDIVGFSIFAYTAVLAIGSLTNTQILSPASGILFALFVGLQEHIEGTSSIAEGST